MINLAIIEDDLLPLAPLLRHIEAERDIHLVHSSAHPTKTSTLPPAEVVLMGINAATYAGPGCVENIRTQLPLARILLLTAAEKEEIILECLKAGAIGHVCRKDPPQIILQGIRMAHRDEAVVNGRLTRKILRHVQQPAANLQGLERYNLTAREKEILMFLLKGLTYKEIAAACFISVETINSHIKKIYGKLGVRSRGEIAARFR